MIRPIKRNSLRGIIIGLALIGVLCMVGLTNAKSEMPQPPTEVKNISLRVAEGYKATNPQIVKVKSTRVEVTNEPMYIVYLTGEFQKGNLKASNLSFSVLADGKKVWALRASDNNNKDIWQESEINLITNALVTNSTPPTGNVVDTTALMEKYLKDHGYSISTATGGGNLAGAKIQLPISFNAVSNNVKIGELLREKNELSKRNKFDFSMYLGQKVSVFTLGLEGKADSPNGLSVFFLIQDDHIVGVWFEPSSVNGEKNMTLSIFESM